MLSILCPPFFSGILGFSLGEFTGLAIPLAAFVLAGVITVAAMYFRHRRRELWHETARIALEKGQPLPPQNPDEDDEVETSTEHRTADHDVRGGLILIAVGAGLWVMFGAMSPSLRYVGAIPGFIGVALLLFALLTRKNRQPPRDPPTRL